MATVIIPDKICPHCGGNEWLTWKEGARIRYRCIIKNRESSKKQHLKHPDKYKKYRDKAKGNGTFYIKLRERNKKDAETLSNSYVKRLAASSLKKKYSEVTYEEIIKKREELIKYREYRKIPKKIRRKNTVNKSQSKGIKNLSDRYMKMCLINRSDIKSKSDITKDMIIRQRASILAYRKANHSNSYVKGCIQSAIKNSTGITIPFKEISKYKMEKYRYCLIKLRKMRELKKLLTTKN